MRAESPMRSGRLLMAFCRNESTIITLAINVKIDGNALRNPLQLGRLRGFIKKQFVMQTKTFSASSRFPLRIVRQFGGYALLILALMGCSSTQSQRPESAREEGARRNAVAEVEAVPPLPSVDSEKDPPAIAEGRSVFFARGSADIDQEALKVLERHASRLRSDPRLVVTLIGHSDHLGSRSYNLAIAEQRVAAVAKVLRTMEVQRNQIRKISLGNEKPGVACQSDSCRRKWRRVDLSYPKKKIERRVGRAE